MVEKTWVESRQALAIGEQHIGAILGLIDDPVAVLARQPGFFQQRVYLPRPAFEQFGPGQVAKRFGQFLSLGRIVQAR